MGGTVTHNRLSEFLADEIVVSALVPWPCPSVFGPNERYRLDEVVAATQHSLVYRASDTRLSDDGFNASVAIKIQRIKSTSSRREASLQRRVRHPHVLRVLDLGITDDGLEYVVTDFVDGITLADWQRPASLRAVVQLMEKIARGVQAAHTAGVCHLDLKPANILMTADGQPKVADFGLAYLAHDARADAPSPAKHGNLAFMSPEQFFGLPNAASPASDIFALGGLFYWMLSGRLPHGSMQEEITRTHRDRPGRLPPCSDRTLSAICFKALAHVPDDRHHSAGQLADDLAAWLDHRPIAWLRPSLSRSCVLWAQRHKVLAAVLVVVTTSLLSGTATAWWVRGNEYRSELSRQEFQLEAAVEQQKNAEQQIDRLKSDMRKSIRTFANSIFVRSPANLPSALVWLTWLSNLIIVDESGNYSPLEETQAILQNIITDQCSQGANTSIECLMARYALAFVLLQHDDELGARIQLKTIRGTWSSILPSTDPIWRQLAILDDCVVAINRSGENTVNEQNAAQAALSQRISHADADGPAERLAREVLRRVSRDQP